MDQFSLKELYDTRIKSTYPLEIGSRKFETGEVLAYFDSLQLANFNEAKQLISAKGGYGNHHQVFWTQNQLLNLNFKEGIFSKTQFALLNNSKLLNRQNDDIKLSARETFPTEIGGTTQVILKNAPVGQIFCYSQDFQKIVNFSLNDNIVIFDEPQTCEEIIVDYEFIYKNNSQSFELGNELISGFVSLEGRTRYKEDNTGKTRTGIVKIPKLKIVSQLSMRLGEDAAPLSCSFQAIGEPVGPRGNQHIMTIDFLADDIDANIG